MAEEAVQPGSVRPSSAKGPEGVGTPTEIELGNSSSFTLLQKKEWFLRNAFWFLKDGVVPPTSKTGPAKAKAEKRFRERVKSAKLTLVWDGNKEVLVKRQDLRRVLWADERFRAVVDIHQGEGHYPGSREKTRVKVQERYWFPQLTLFVSEVVKRCTECQFEKAGKAPRSDREIHPTPPTAPFYRVHVDTAGRFEPSGVEQYRHVGVQVLRLTLLLSGLKSGQCRQLKRRK